MRNTLYFFATTIILLLLTSSLSVAQDYEAKVEESHSKRLIQEIGIFAGPSVNFLRGNGAVDNNFQNEKKLLIGRSIGIKIRSKTFFKKLTLSAELMFDRKWGKSLSTTEYFDLADQMLKLGVIEFRYKYKYYTIPLRLEYALGKNNKFKIEGGGGMQVILKNRLKKESHYLQVLESQ